MNHGYMLVFYDVNEKRVNKIFKICKKYLNHFQNSVFRGDITPSDTIKLKEELQKVIKDDDKICFIKLQSRYSFDEEIISDKKDKKKKPENFL